MSRNVVRAGDLGWIRGRVAQMLSGWALAKQGAPVIHRKADDGGAQAEDKGAEAKVSAPGDPAEKKGDEKEAEDGEGKAEAKEAAPEIGAKLV